MSFSQGKIKQTEAEISFFIPCSLNPEVPAIQPKAGSGFQGAPNTFQVFVVSFKNKRETQRSLNLAGTDCAVLVWH